MMNTPYSQKLDSAEARRNAQRLTSSVRKLYEQKGHCIKNADSNVLAKYGYLLNVTETNVYAIATKPDDSTIVGKHNTRRMFDLEEPTTFLEFSKMSSFDSLMLAEFRYTFISDLISHKDTRDAFKAGASCWLGFVLGGQWIEQRTYVHFDKPTDVFPSCIIRICTINSASNKKNRDISQPEIRDINQQVMSGLTHHLTNLYKQNLLSRFKFTPKELEIAQLGGEGLTRKQIHTRLGGSLQTVTTHTKHITAKWKEITKEHVDKFNDVGVCMGALGLL